MPLRALSAVALLSLAACEPAAEPVAVSPVVQNFTYNTTNTTHFYAQPTVAYAIAPPPFVVEPWSAPPAAPLPPPPPPPPPRVAVEEPRAVVVESPPRTGTLRAGLTSTTVASCDAYLVRLEVCTTGMLSGPPRRGPTVWTSQDPAALTRSLATFDLMRRNWRRAAQYPLGRESLEDSCLTSLGTYNESVRGYCP